MGEHPDTEAPSRMSPLPVRLTPLLTKWNGNGGTMPDRPWYHFYHLNRYVGVSLEYISLRSRAVGPYQAVLQVVLVHYRLNH